LLANGSAGTAGFVLQTTGTSTQWVATSQSLGIGGSVNLNALSSIAVGDTNTVSGLAASAFGYQNTASSPSSIAIGRSNSVTANNSIAMGGFNTVSDAASYTIWISKQHLFNFLNCIWIQ
jgi:hypothetical protein